jgi:hypothetical protein
MSPPKRRGSYKAPRNRRELTVAVLSSLAIIVVTATLIWVLRPNKDLGTSPTPVTTSTPTVTAAPTTTAPPVTTVAPTDTTPSDSVPETTP